MGATVARRKMNELLQKNGEPHSQVSHEPGMDRRDAEIHQRVGKGRIRVLQRVGPEGCRAHQIIERTAEKWGLWQ